MDTVLPFAVRREVDANGHESWACDLLLYQDFRPSWLKHLRIYELAPALKDDDALDVLADALEIKDHASADAIIREYGIVGRWRPSSIIVERFVSVATQRIIAQNVVAHALWNTDLHFAAYPNEYYELRLRTEPVTPVQLRPEGGLQPLRPVLHLEGFTDEEMQAARAGTLGASTNVVSSHERRIADLERVVKILGKFARQTNQPLMEILITRASEQE